MAVQEPTQNYRLQEQTLDDDTYCFSCPVVVLRHCSCCAGDNVLTGISVARECGMVGLDEPVLALTVTAPGDGTPASLSAAPVVDYRHSLQVLFW